MDQIFEAKGYDDEKSFKIASLKLTRYASLLFENVKKQRSREGKRKINSWEKLKCLMNKRFFPRVISKISITSYSHLNKTT